jgi:hypothetical protein
MDLTIQEREADLIIGTFGRSLYALDDIRPLRTIASNNKILANKLVAFKTPDAYLAETKDIPGYGSGGDGLYEASNRTRQARLTYFLNPDMGKSTKPDTATVRVYDAGGKLIRTFIDKPDTVGIQRTTWDLRERGIRQPGSKKPCPKSAEPTGLPVLPGSYKVVISYKDLKDSTMVNVLADPRFTYPKEAILARRAMADRLAITGEKLTAAIDQLNDADNTLKVLADQVKSTEDASWKGWSKKVKAMQDTVKAKRELIEPKPLGKQGYGRPFRQTALTVWRDAYYTAAGSPYSGGKPFAPNADDEKMIEDAEQYSAKILSQLNSFFNTEWEAFRKEAEAQPSLLFKNYTD